MVPAVRSPNANGVASASPGLIALAIYRGGAAARGVLPGYRGAMLSRQRKHADAPRRHATRLHSPTRIAAVAALNELHRREDVPRNQRPVQVDSWGLSAGIASRQLLSLRISENSVRSQVHGEVTGAYSAASSLQVVESIIAFELNGSR